MALLKKVLTGFLTTSLLGAYAHGKVDVWGHYVPKECNDVSDVDVPIEEVSREELSRILADARNPSIKPFGAWLPENKIVLLENMPEPLYTYALNHEKCHAKMFMLYGMPYWHK